MNKLTMTMTNEHVNKMDSEPTEKKETGFLYLPSTSIAVLRAMEETETTTSIKTVIPCTATRKTERCPLNTWLEIKIDLTHDINIGINGVVPAVSSSEEGNENSVKMGFKNEKSSKKS